MPVWDFTFNGETASSKNIIVTSIQRPMLPALRPRKLVIPGKDGAWDFGNNTYDERIINVVCLMSRPFRIQEQIRSIAYWLSQKGTIIFSDETDKYYVGRLYTELLQEIDGSMGSFVLPFECEPYAYADQETYNETYIYDDTWELDTGLLYPNEATFDWLYFRQSMALYNHSQIPTDIEFKISGSAAGIKVTHVESGCFLDLQVTISSETVIIDTESYKCELASGTNLLGDLAAGSDFFKLQPGINSFIFEGSGPNCTVEYTWKHKFL